MNLRKIHTWASVALIVPILIVGGTAILIGHHDALGTKQVTLPMAAPAESRGLPLRDHEVRAILAEPDGTLLYATKYGLKRSEGGAALVSAGLDHDLRDIERLDAGLLVAAKEGLYFGGSGRWTRLAAGDFRSISGADGGFLATSDQGAWTVSAQGIARPAQGLAAPLAAASDMGMTPPYTLEKLVMDLHTGAFFFGKTWEWVWIDLVGGVMVLLGVSGIVIWRRSERARTRQAEARLAVARPAAAPVPAE